MMSTPNLAQLAEDRRYFVLLGRKYQLHTGTNATSRMIGVCVPSGLVVFGLVSPTGPTATIASRKELQVRPPAACLDNFVLFIRFSRLFTFAAGEIIYLGSSGFQ